MTTTTGNSRIRLLARSQAAGLENARTLRRYLQQHPRHTVPWAVRYAISDAHLSTLRTVAHLRREQEHETADWRKEHQAD
jgi:hypothetical protein